MSFLMILDIVKISCHNVDYIMDQYQLTCPMNILTFHYIKTHLSCNYQKIKDGNLFKIQLTDPGSHHILRIYIHHDFNLTGIIEQGNILLQPVNQQMQGIQLPALQKQLVPVLVP